MLAARDLGTLRTPSKFHEQPSTTRRPSERPRAISIFAAKGCHGERIASRDAREGGLRNVSSRPGKWRVSAVKCVGGGGLVRFSAPDSTSNTRVRHVLTRAPPGERKSFPSPGLPQVRGSTGPLPVTAEIGRGGHRETAVVAVDFNVLGHLVANVCMAVTRAHATPLASVYPLPATEPPPWPGLPPFSEPPRTPRDARSTMLSSLQRR